MFRTGVFPLASAPAEPADPFAAAFRAAGTAMLLTDPRREDHPIVAANDAFSALTGYRPTEVLGRNCRFLQGPDTERDAVGRLREAVAAGEPASVEILNYRRDGTPFRNALTVNPVRDEGGAVRHFVATLADATEAASTRRELARLRDGLETTVAERTRTLQVAFSAANRSLAEADHRLRNNLQTVHSLLLLQARRAGDGAVREAMGAMAERVSAMSAALRHLHGTGDAARFDLGACLSEIAEELAALSGPGRIRLDLSLEPVALPADQAVPAALLVGELLAGAAKAASADGTGRLAVAAGGLAGSVRVAVEHGGAGEGFGRILVDLLARQLRAAVAWEEAGPGTRAVVSWPLGAQEGRA